MTILKDSLHRLYLAFFKPITLAERSEQLPEKVAWIIYLKVLSVTSAIAMTFLAVAGALCVIRGGKFYWGPALQTSLMFELAIGGLIGIGVWSKTFGLASGLVIGMIVGPGLGLVIGLATGLPTMGPPGPLGESPWGVFFGIGLGTLSGLVSGPLGVLAFNRWIPGRLGITPYIELCGLSFGVLLGLFFSGPEQRFIEGLWIFVTYQILFQLTFSRFFYSLPYAFQDWRSKKTCDIFKIFHNSPIYWDETIPWLFPGLTNWLVRLVMYDRERGLTEILHIAAKRPYQRKAAQKAMLTVMAQDLQQINSLDEMTKAPVVLMLLPFRRDMPIKSEYYPEGWSEIGLRLNTVSTLARDYSMRRTQVGQLKVLGELQHELEAFRDAMVLTNRPVGTTFQPIASRWLEIVKQTKEECRQQLSFEPIPNPFVAGPPLHQRDHDLFMGRKDIIIAIEENIINPDQRPALMLYGRRRIGKTSTLLNLPRLLSSQFTPIFIDCQNAKWRDGDAAFCYHLANSLYGEFFQRNLLDDLGKPVLEQFENYAFTRLDEFLDQVEALSRRINKQILLTFDEYERLEEGIVAQKITREVFNQLRNIVQHRARIVVLFSGSHRFEELRVVNWSDYLINVKTLELSFLAPEDARELLTEPVPALHYEPGVVDAIIALTHCQPYLLQAVASDLVNYLNAQKRQTATMADLDVAVAKVLVTADAYFHNNWAECSDDDRQALRALAADEAVSTQVEPHQTAWQSLSRKEIVEMRDDRYRFVVELFRLWILKNHLPAPLRVLSPERRP